MSEQKPAETEGLQDQDDIAAVERLKDAFSKLKGEMAKVIVGQQPSARRAVDRHLRPRPLPVDRRARTGQDPDDPHDGRRAQSDAITAFSSRPT